MNTKDKAKRIALDAQSGKNNGFLETYLISYESALEMAKWKDEQFAKERKELIAKANQAITNSHETGSQFMKERLIERAIEWIDYNNRNGGCWFDNWEEDFKQAMKEE